MVVIEWKRRCFVLTYLGSVAFSRTTENLALGPWHESTLIPVGYNASQTERSSSWMFIIEVLSTLIFSRIEVSSPAIEILQAFRNSRRDNMHMDSHRSHLSLHSLRCAPGASVMNVGQSAEHGIMIYW